MMDPDPEGEVGQEGGEWGDRGSRDADDEEETNAAWSSAGTAYCEWPVPGGAR